MKPRQRQPQAQKSRLYSRGNDHRDILFYNETTQKMVYHNALYWNDDTDNAKPDKEHIAWIKYPKKALMHRVKPFTGWIDVDRQFCYGDNYDGNQRSGSFYKLRNGLVIYCGAYSGLSDMGCYAIEDGIVWNELARSKFSFFPIAQQMFYIGDDIMAYLVGGSYWQTGDDHRYIYWTRIYKDEDGEFQVEQGNATLDCDASWINWGTPLLTCGTIGNTFIVMKEVMDYYANSCQQWFFSIDTSGHVEMLSDPVPQPTYMSYMSGGGDGEVWAQQGNRLFFATMSVISYDGYVNRTSQITVWMSMNGGRSWTKEVLFGGKNLADYDDQHGGLQHRLEMFNRDGEIFLLFGQACDKDGSGWHSVHLYSTLTGTSWSEIPLPKWVDLPIINEPSGQGVYPYGKDTIRVAIRPQETSNQDYNMFDLIEKPGLWRTYSMDIDHGNIMFQDGEMKDMLDTDFYMVIGTGSLHLYFDNRYMAESTKAFAWYTQAYDSQYDGDDHVIPYDYVLG